MRKVIYLMNASLDGFVEGLDGKFDWIRPDEELHRFHQQLAAEQGGFLYGRRMYETMAVWQTLDQDQTQPEYMLDFARVWKARPKIVFSTTLTTVGENCRLVHGDAGAEVTRLKQQAGDDLGVSGAGLAATLARLGLIDEYRLVTLPVLVGGGKSYFPALDHKLRLQLLETKTFASGATYRRYAVVT